MATKSYIIALEEHYYDPEVKRHASGLDAIAGASATDYAAAMAANRFGTLSANIFTSRPAGSPPIRRCCTA